LLLLYDKIKLTYLIAKSAEYFCSFVLPNRFLKILSYVIFQHLEKQETRHITTTKQQ